MAIHRIKLENRKQIAEGTMAFQFAKPVGDLTLPIFYIAGPQAMVLAMREILNEAGVNDDNIRTEEFTGY